MWGFFGWPYIQGGLLLHGGVNHDDDDDDMTSDFNFTETRSQEPGLYEGHFIIDSMDQVKDTFMSFSGWNKGIAFVNNFNIGRFWPVQLITC